MSPARILLFGAVLTAARVHAGAAEALHFSDDFAGYPPGGDGAPTWDVTGFEWEMSGGRFVASDKARSFAIAARAPFARRVTVEATLLLRKATGHEWKTTGVAIVLDERNYWHFALVESPDKAGGKHYVELCEMLDGVWLSQGEPATRLTELESLDPQFDWQYDRPYRLRIELAEQEIAGTLGEPGGRVLARKRYRLDNRAVKAGRPALTCGGFATAFDDFAATCDETVPAPEPQKRTFPPYTQAGRVPLPDDPKGRATGFFHVEEHGGRWWVIDPKGRSFYIVGTDHANYHAHWCEKLGYAPYHRNMAEKFKGDEKAWAADTAERLLAWGFNSVAAGHSPSLRYRGLAWMGFLSLGTGFSDVSDIAPKTTWTGFPNVFHPKFAAWCDRRAREQCAELKDDPWLIGYFMDNELEWFGKSWHDWSLADEAFKKPPGHSAKTALLAFLKGRYPAIEALNAAWGTRVASYDALAQSTEALETKTDHGRKDKVDFVRLIAEKYFAITAAAIRKHDPNHMVLGCRFAGALPPVGDIAGKYCDIFSINCYRWVDLETGVVRDFEKDLREWHAAVKRPFMITEWSFPALDSGLPCRHGAGQRFDTQAQRARAFTIFQTLLFSTPFMVGSNYFMWVDEPAEGISSTFPEDSNYGLVNVRNEPYQPLAEAAARLNPLVYGYHSGRLASTPEHPGGRPPRVTLPDEEQAATRSELGLALDAKGAVAFASDGATWSVENGVLRLASERPSGNAFGRVLLKGQELGKFVPVIWQNVGQDLWPQPETAKIAGVSNGPVRLVLDIEFELRAGSKHEVRTRVDDQGKPARLEQGPGAFRTRYRFFVYPDKPWFGAQFLWLENTDTRPWEFQGYFHYALPNLGGDARDDEVGGPDVPSYYLSDSVVCWSDRKAKLHYGVVATRAGDFQMHFWKNPAGGFHADVHREVKKRLQPGERYAEPQPIAWVFGASGAPEERPWLPILHGIRGWAAVEVKAFAVGNAP